MGEYWESEFPLLAWAAWQLQFSPAACGTLRKHVTKHFPQPAAPPGTITMIADRSQPALMTKRRREARDSRNLPSTMRLLTRVSSIDSPLLHAIKSLAEAQFPVSILKEWPGSMGQITNIVCVVPSFVHLSVATPALPGAPESDPSLHSHIVVVGLRFSHLYELPAY